MTFLELVLITGATARLTRLIQTDTILERPRGWLLRLLERSGHPRLVELLTCPWCLSMWVGAAAVGSWWVWQDRIWWMATTAVCTSSHVVGLLDVWEER